MTYQRAYKIGPKKTPFIIKLLISIMVVVSLASAISSMYLNYDYIAYFLSLSLVGIKKFFLWQLLTYGFLQPGFGLNVGFIAHLIFNMYIFWVIGSDVVLKSSKKDFLNIFFASLLISGLIALLAMFIGYPFYMHATTSVSVYAILVAWMMLSPQDTNIHFFQTTKIKIKWVVLAIIGFNLLINFSDFDFVKFFSYVSAALVAYFYCIIVYLKNGPFKKCHSFERMLMKKFKKEKKTNIKKRKK
jgi:membrane associated rhomboid family serine protease